MSLKIWLPMNRDLRNQGLLNNTITNSGATYSSDGKLGGCYVFDGVNDSLTVGNLSTMVDTDFSFACWFYKDEWGTKRYETIFGGSSGFELESKVSSTNSPVLKLYNWGGGSCTYELSKWNHIVFTRNTTETKLYLNGELKATGTAGTIPNHDYFVGSWNSTTQQNFKGKMCDVRIYDHCLSEMEVKQLSQGLVLHYPLSDNSIQQLNNCYTNPTFNSSSASAGWSHWGSSGNKGTYGQNTDPNYIYKANQSYSHWVADGADATKSFLVYQSPAFGGGQRSLQCICKEENSLPISDSIVFPAWNARNGGTPNERWTSITSLGNGFYHCKCENIQQSGSDDLVGFYVRPGYKVYFSEAYLENDKECCSNIFYSTNVIYDTSGFCNNGSSVGTFTISSDTPKYQVSTKFSANTIKDTTFNFTSNTWTVAFWYYFDTAPSAYQGFLCLSRNAGSDVDKKFAAMPNSSYIWFKFENTNLTVSSLKTKAWTHIAMTFDGTNGKVYENGVLKSTTSAASSIYTNCDDFVVGARASAVDATATTCQLVGDLSDVRIYATALSPTDVKSLYQNCATIDPDGTIRGQIRS